MGSARPRRSFKRIKNDLIYHATALIVRALTWLPHPMAALLGRGLGWLAWHLGRREQRRALENLARVYPGLPSLRRRQIARRCFTGLGLSAMECVVMGRLRARFGTEASPVRFTRGSRRALLEAHGRGRGVLFVTAHIGNWELMAAAVADQLPVSVLFKPSYDDRFTRMISRFRGNSGIESIPVSRKGHLRQALQALERGRVLGVLMDSPTDRGWPTSFLGRPAWTSTLVASIASRRQVPVVVGFIHRMGSCQHAISVRLLEPGVTIQGGRGLEPVHAVTEQLSYEIEREILSLPEEWVWSLDRWRSTDSLRMSSTNAIVVPETPIQGDCPLQ
jgi:KDO2-lipid IV(A) lauroyltransferase